MRCYAAALSQEQDCLADLLTTQVLSNMYQVEKYLRYYLCSGADFAKELLKACSTWSPF